MEKRIGELHAILIEYEKGLPKKAETSQLMMIKSGKIQKANKKLLKAKGKGKANGKGKDKQSYIPKPKNLKPSAKEHPAKHDTCHHCKEVGVWKRNCPIYLARLLKKKNKLALPEGLLRSTDDESCDQCVSCLSSKMTRKSFPHRLERATDLLEIIHTDVCGLLRHVSRQESKTRILNMVPTKKVDKTPYELWYGKVSNLSYLKVWGCEVLVKRDTLEKLQQRSVKCIFIRYPKETIGYYFYFLPENKIVVARYVEFFEKNLITQKVSGRAIDLKEIQDEDTSPSKITSKIPMEVEGFELSQEEVILIHRSERIHQAPNRLCLNVEAVEHSLGDLNEPTSYKFAMLDLKSNK
uniref:Retrotransposon protein, putative, Ty1-copia subclass n=1 Tax=Tanacetum cinerariifolium TaxID=118510 RepID=A0A699IVI0_TANCI|nr:retrotransposon protein, putative, Ty1-copia subclass [Tanacetum cinerariifolium]